MSGVRSSILEYPGRLSTVGNIPGPSPCGSRSIPGCSFGVRLSYGKRASREGNEWVVKTAIHDRFLHALGLVGMLEVGLNEDGESPPILPLCMVLHLVISTGGACPPSKKTCFTEVNDRHRDSVRMFVLWHFALHLDLELERWMR
ncbi:hypothetical protein C8F04DRAFT_1186076 [Mycena alexandri]|uniref:Uncharacterized protein n=1 Tax=Mycena alexandri TaxID=1745969 RepID=A0AAD6ST14_9AGAR|nr:hypothetical protein C8F04DRAFT_1186076 [Mycena alexandri]